MKLYILLKLSSATLNPYETYKPFLFVSKAYKTYKPYKPYELLKACGGRRRAPIATRALSDSKGMNLFCDKASGEDLRLCVIFFGDEVVLRGFA